MKILYVTTIGITMNFFKSFIGELVNEGHTVDIACNDSESPVDDFYTKLGCKIYSISTSRSPFSTGNIRAVKQIRKIAKDGGYDIVHCHTPLAAAASRLACRPLRKDKIHPVKVIYTAHGFHFYKGAPLKNWLIFYPVEKYCAKFTDVLITINKEDYSRAQKKFRAGRIEYVPGVGIDVKKFEEHKLTETQCHEIREAMGVPDDAVLLLSVGELNENKNHETVIRAVAKIVAEKHDKEIYYAVAGKGEREEHLRKLSKELGIGDRVKLLGFRTDVIDLYKVADVFVHPSFREGLPVSVMEALASGLVVVGSDIRGNRDLIEDNMGIDYLFIPLAIDDVAMRINKAIWDQNEEKKESYWTNINTYDYKTINSGLKEIYERITG